MAGDPALLGIAAIENTIAGSLLPNHELLRQSRARIVGEQKLRISHVAAALPGQGLDAVSEVRSHPIALMQCGDFLKAHPALKVVERDDTAGSAREIAEGRLCGTAAICGADAAELYGLEILEREIETTKHNFTRFLLLADESRAEAFFFRTGTHRQGIAALHPSPHAGQSVEGTHRTLVLRHQPDENPVAADRRPRMGVPLLRGRHLRPSPALPPGRRRGPPAHERLPHPGRIRRMHGSGPLNHETTKRKTYFRP